jgi:16S rRNA (guanine966-N2)-methyltransferase
MLSKIRVIAGKYRGRNVHWRHENIRPTPSIMRERLFNWIQFEVKDKTCIDLFSGSGILGIEALSRGAKHCTFVDINVSICNMIAENLDNFRCPNENFLVLRETIPSTLTLSRKPEIIFCDPPYNLKEMRNLIRWLDVSFDGAMLYFESRKRPAFPENWQVLKSAKQGQCNSWLIKIGKHD